MLSASQQSNAIPSAWQRRRKKFFRPERLGQTLASLCWIASVFVYGINSSGDLLQLCAASAWFLANMAAVVAVSPTKQADSIPSAAGE